MWFKDSKGNYQNLETGHRFLVTPVDDARKVRTWEFRSVHPQGGNVVLQDGYRTEEDARNDMDEFLKKQKISFTEIEIDEIEDDDTQGSEPVKGKGGK